MTSEAQAPIERQSRVGKRPIPIIKGVEVSFDAQSVRFKGPKGELKRKLPPLVELRKDGDNLIVALKKDAGLDGLNFQGLTRALLANMAEGVAKGYTMALDLHGVGYRAAVQGKVLNLTLGFSHAVNFPIPDGISMETPSQTEITIKGIDLQKVGQVAAKIRAIRPPEPYKGKGVRYVGEQIVMKEGKKK